MNKLLMAQISSSAISQLFNNQPGYIGRVLGEAVYIMKCRPTVVKVRRTEKCYHELPIEFNNGSAFMSPLTHVIQFAAEEVDCNPVTPPLYQLEGRWIGMSPTPVVASEPMELRADKETLLNLEPIRPVGSSGLYTQEELDQVGRTLTVGTERKAVQNIITRRVAGMEAGGQGFSTVGIFNAEELKELAVSTSRQIWGWFTDFGLFISGLLGFHVIFRVLKYVIGSTLNGIQLYQAVGCGFGLIACVWNTLTMWVLNRHSRADTSKTPDSSAAPEQVPEVRVSMPVTGAVNDEQPVPNSPGGYAYPNVHWTDALRAGALREK